MNLGIISLSLCQALLTTGTILLVSVMALIGQKMAPSNEWTTLPVAFQFIGLMCATIPASLIMNKIGRKRGFSLGNVIGISGALFCIQALHNESFWLFCFGAFLLGIAIGFGTLYRFAAVEMCDKGQQARAISIVMAGGVLAAVAGPNLAIFSKDIVNDAPFVGAFWGLFGLYVIALMVLTTVKFPPQVVHHPDTKIRPIGQIIRQPIFLVAVAAAMISYTVMNLLMTATPLAMHGHGFSFSQSALVIELHALGMFIPGFFTGHLITRFGTVRMMLVGAMVILACIAVNLNGQSQLHFSIALFTLGVGWNFMFVSATNLVTNAYSEAEKPKAQAANEFLIFSMVTLSALGSGWLEASLGWQVMNLLSIPVILLAIVVIFYFHTKELIVLESR
ncbi:MAG: MFS transporter [Piscirickettsiaceae bacterium]|nr:MFS transporter [Piscirickettsiaceae bacterium]